MPATVAGIHLGPDTHANRPAANASGLPVGALYLCSDHDLIYITDGSAWTTWATVGGSGGGSGTVYPYTDMDEPPATPHASDMEGTSLTGWSWLTSSGTVTNASGILSGMFDSDSGPANPQWNVDDDVAAQVVFQPLNGGKLAKYRSWAPAAGADWAVVVKARMIPGNNVGTADDRLMIGVTSDATPSIASNEVANSIAAELRTNSVTTGFGHGVMTPGTRSNETTSQIGIIYAAITGRTDNSIQIWSSTDGMWWRRKSSISSGTAPAGAGTVRNVFVYCQALAGTGMAPVIVVDWVRFSETTNNLLMLGGGR